MIETTDLRLIDLVPVLEDLPAPLHEALAGRLNVSADTVFAVEAESLGGREDEIARLIATEILALARSRRRPPILARPLRAVIPLSEYAASGTEYERLPHLTLRDMRALDGIDETLTQLVTDVLVFGSGVRSALKSLTHAERVYLAATAGAIATQKDSILRDLEAPLALAAAWAHWEAGVESFTQLAEAVRQGAPPRDVEEAWERVGRTGLAAVGARKRYEFDPTASLHKIIAAIGDRQLIILERRTWSIGRSSTLQELAQEFGVTRERVRQLELQALEKLENELNRPEHAVVGRAARLLADTLGMAAPLDRLRGTWVRPALGGDADELSRLSALLMLHLTGPYELWEEWIIRRPAKENVSATARALDALFERGLPLVDEALVQLEQAGVRKESVRDWLGLQSRVRVLEEYVVPWAGTLADKAEVILRVSGRPLTFDEIADTINEEFSARTLRNYLSTDARFRRLGLRVFGLDEWGGEEYTTISDELAEEIERRGGEARLDDLVQTLTAQFGVSANSVRAYASGPQFERSSGGSIRLRRARAHAPKQPVELTKRCFRIGPAWAFRTTVTTDTLRGSGIGIPQGFAAYLRLAHGHTIELRSDLGLIRFTWPSLVPTMSSLKLVAESFGAVAGDFLFIAALPDEGTAIVQHVAKRDFARTSSRELRLLLEVGATQASPDELRSAVAQAVGLEPDETWSAVRRRLRTRGEEDIMALLPIEELDHDKGLDELMALVGV